MQKKFEDCFIFFTWTEYLKGFNTRNFKTYIKAYFHLVTNLQNYDYIQKYLVKSNWTRVTILQFQSTGNFHCLFKKNRFYTSHLKMWANLGKSKRWTMLRQRLHKTIVSSQRMWANKVHIYCQHFNRCVGSGFIFFRAEQPEESLPVQNHRNYEVCMEKLATEGDRDSLVALYQRKTFSLKILQWQSTHRYMMPTF